MRKLPILNSITEVMLQLRRTTLIIIVHNDNFLHSLLEILPLFDAAAILIIFYRKLYCLFALIKTALLKTTKMNCFQRSDVI